MDGLKQAILTGAKSGLDEAVAAERLTREQADAIYERLQSVIDDLVDGTLPGPGGRGFGHRFGGPPGTEPPDGDGFGGASTGTALYWDTAA